MKLKTALVLTLLVLTSLLSFSNRSNTNCDGRQMIVSVKPSDIAEKANAYEAEIQAAGMSPLLRIAVTL